MDVRTRMKIIKILDKMDRNPIYSKKLGNKDASVFLYYENTKKKGR